MYKDTAIVGPIKGENISLEQVQKFIKNTPSALKKQYSDGYHSLDELYEFIKVHNAALFNEWAKCNTTIQEIKEDLYDECPPLYDVHKSRRHYNGEECFGGDWFIVVAMLPTGQISNHYHIDDWDLFEIPETEKAKYPFDGHTPKDVLQRLKAL